MKYTIEYMMEYIIEYTIDYIIEYVMDYIIRKMKQLPVFLFIFIW